MPRATQDAPMARRPVRRQAALLSDGGVPIERISRLAGHTGTTVTERSTAISSGP
jgi:hypothetical protein